MANLKRFADKAKNVVDKRGGVDSLKEDASELRGIAKGEGSLKDKAKAAGKAIKDPGAKGPDQPGEGAGKEAPSASPEADEPTTRSK